MGVVIGEESPGQLLGARDTDPAICEDTSLRTVFAGNGSEKPAAFRFVIDEIDSVMVSGDAQCHAEFSRAGTQIGESIPPSSLPHDVAAVNGLQGSQQNEAAMAIQRILHQHVGQPIHSIVQIHIGGPGGMLLDKASGAGAEKGVAGFVSDLRIGFGLHHDA